MPSLHTYRAELQPALLHLLDVHASDLTAQPDAPRGLVQHARQLWTYAHALRHLPEAAERAVYERTAVHAQTMLCTQFRDDEWGGFFWLLDAHGRGLQPQKLVYGQAFAIYGLSEWFLAADDADSLTTAVDLYHLLEQHAADPVYGGYFEAFQPDWTFTDAINVDETAVVTVKSMNTHLHVLEAYTNLLRAWDDARLRDSLRALIRIMLDRIIDPATGHQRLHFDAAWRALTDHVSPGHDIEASWLLVEAAEVLGEPELLAETTAVALQLARSTYAEGRHPDGSLRDEDASRDRIWWAQAEAMVGFFNAYQLTGDPRFYDASLGCWAYARDQLVDPASGGWLWGLTGDGAPIPREKAGLWKTPYHNGRACFELTRRIDALLTNQ